MAGQRWLVAWMLGGVVSVMSASAGAEPVEVAGGALRVEVAEGIENAAELPGWIAERNPELARKVAEGPGRERWIAVEIEGEYLDFRYRVVPMRDGEVVGEAGEWVACKGGNDQLLADIDAGIASALERLRAAEDRGGGVGEEPATREGEPAQQALPEPEYRKMTGVGIAGIVVGAVGAGGVVAGGVLFGRGERVVADYQHFVQDYRPAGLAALVSGGALLGAGVAMLVTDIVQCRRKHPRCLVDAGGGASAKLRRSMVLGPWLAGRFAGLAGRF